MARIGEGQGFNSNEFKKAIYAIRGNNHQTKGMACAVSIEGQNEGTLLLVTDTWKGPEPITGCRLHRYSRKKQHFEDYQLKPSRITQRGPFSLVLCDGKDSSFKIKTLHINCLSVQQLERDFRVYTIHQDKCKVLELKYSDGSYNLMDQGLYDFTLCGSPIIDEDNFKKYLVGVLMINAEGKAIPRFLSRGVLDQPEFTTDPQSETLVQGSSVTFSSDANGIPEPTFSWTKDGSAVTANDRISLSADNKQLSITNVNRTDSGEYRCVATNSVGKVNSNAAILTIHYQPEFTAHPQSEKLVQGSSVTFSIDATGVPEPKFSWTKDGSAVTVNDRISLSADNKELSITNVNRTDIGEYRCVATNTVNTVNSNGATLTVQAGQHQWYQRVLIAITGYPIEKIAGVAMIVLGPALAAHELIRRLWIVERNNSIHVELHFCTRENFLSLMEDLKTGRVKRRLKKEFEKVGCEGELEVTLMNEEEVYKALDQIRVRMAMSKREGEIPADDSREENIATSAVSSHEQEPDRVEAKEDLEQMRKGIEELIDKSNISKTEEERNEIEAKEDLDQMRKGKEELIDKPNISKAVEERNEIEAKQDLHQMRKGIEELIDKPNISKAEEERNENPRKRDVAFTTAPSEGEQTMRKDVECEIPAAAVADVAERGGTCSKVLKPQYFRADLHYNQKFVPESKQSSYFVLQDLVNYKCSSEFEKYLCDTSVPPCEPDDMSVYVHCQDICEQVMDVSNGKFENTRICDPDCSLAYLAERVTAGDPRKRDVAFTTAPSEGDQTMRKDVECEMRAAAVADVAKRGGTCGKVFKPQYCTADLDYNQTFVPECNRSSYSVPQDTSNYKCREEINIFREEICSDTLFKVMCEPSQDIWDSKYKCSSQFVEKICIDTSPSFIFVCEPSRGFCERVRQYGAVIHREFMNVCAGNFQHTRICSPHCLLTDRSERVTAGGGLIDIFGILLPVIITVTVVAAVTVMCLRWRQRQTRDRFVLNTRDVQ